MLLELVLKKYFKPYEQLRIFNKCSETNYHFENFVMMYFDLLNTCRNFSIPSY